MRDFIDIVENAQDPSLLVHQLRDEIGPRRLRRLNENAEYQQWPETISGINLADRIQRSDMHHTPEDWVDGDIDDNICAYEKYDLVDVSPNDLLPDLNLQYDHLIDDYVQRETPPPPVVLDHRGYLIDGTHRAKAAQMRGDKTIRAYKGDESTYSPVYDESDEMDYGDY